MNGIGKALIVVTALMHWIGCSKIENFDDVDLANLPTLSYCDLREASGKYDGKVVKINAQIGNFQHGYYFYDERCAEKVEELLDDNRTAVSFFEPRKSDLSDSLDRMGFVCCYGNPKGVVAVGRFTREYPISLSDSMSDRTSFHFELYSINSANE